MTFALFLLIPCLLFLAVVIWNVVAWPRVVAGAVEEGEISILIPARNEALNLGECLGRAILQGAAVKEILIYDDHSTDTTPALIAEFVRQDNRIRLVPPVSLPSDWGGKNFACHQLASAALGEWLLFLDADAHLDKQAAARMLSEARERQITFLSCWPALEMESFWEKMLLPMLNFMVFTIFPGPLSIRRWDRALGLAHGACLMTRRETYFAVGGHAAVRNAITEDIRLAQLWRERGEHGLCLDGTGTVSVRMYRTFVEIWNGFQKNFFPGFRSEAMFWGFVATHLLIFLLPFCLFPAFIFRAAARGSGY